MRPVVVKPLGFLSAQAHLHLAAEQTSRVGPRGSEFFDDVTDRDTPLMHATVTELAASSRRSAVAPTPTPIRVGALHRTPETHS